MVETQFRDNKEEIKVCRGGSCKERRVFLTEKSGTGCGAISGKSVVAHGEIETQNIRWLSWKSGYFLCRDIEGSRSCVPADLCGYLYKDSSL